MLTFEQIREISNQTKSKIVLLVMDGLGGIPDPNTGKTELETAFRPNLNNLAKSSICGLSIPVGYGITPGSGPGHLALFGYDPTKYIIGRGVLEALGIDFDLKSSDIAARGNFCTVDSTGNITDRRAGRITTDKCAELCSQLRQIKIKGFDIFIEPVRDHRFLLVIRGNELTDDVTDTDPQKTGIPPLKSTSKTGKNNKTADIVNTFILKASTILANYHPANMALLRGFSQLPAIPTLNDIYKLNPAAIARYPMYKGLAKLVGMKIYTVNGDIDDQFNMLKAQYNNHDFFFVHIKETDSAGEDGDFRRKVKVIEKVDTLLPQIVNLNPDVIIVTGDHSTPSILKGHSWHPVPCLIYSPFCRADHTNEFSESACNTGSLGNFQAANIMTLAMANALKFNKFGA